MNARADDHAADAVELLREQLQIGLGGLDAIDRKLALVVPVVGGISALIVRGAAPAAFQLLVLIAGIMVAALATILSLIGLLTRSAAIGVDASRVAWRIRVPYPDYNRDVAQALQRAVKANIKLAEHKARFFNLAAVAASCSILLLVAARIVEVR